MEITAKDTKTEASITVEYEFGETIAELVEKFGEEVVFNQARSSLVVALQGAIRTALKAGKTDDEINTLVSEWKPGIRRQAKSPQDKIKEQLASMDPEIRKALLKELSGK